MTGKANENKEKFYLLAENHNVLSGKHAKSLLDASNDPAAAKFATFETFILTFPPRDPKMSDGEYVTLLKKIFRYVSVLFFRLMHIFLLNFNHCLFFSGRTSPERVYPRQH